MQQFLATMILLGLIGSATAESSNVELRYRSYREWTIKLPDEQWLDVNNGIPVPHSRGEKFAVGVEGSSLRVDSDGDGKLDRTIKPRVDADSGLSKARVVLSGKDTQGDKLRYAARLRKTAKGWQWAPGGVMIGTLPTANGPLPIRIIDQNGNGRFDDFGSDAMVVGARDEATFLSQTVLIDGKLLAFEIDGDGGSLRLKSFDGATAQLDMSSAFDSKAMLLSAIVRSADGKNSFDFGTIEGSAKVPVGTYMFVSGVLGLGKHRVEIRSGKMAPIDLQANKKKSIDWGGPAKTKFQYQRQGDQVAFSPDRIWYYGEGGEEYFNWHPIGKSPEFTIKNSKTGKVIDVAVLPGSS